MKVRYLVAVLLLLFFVPASGHDRYGFNQVVVFGDSLSDTGNMYRLTDGLIPPQPPYYEGRFSNGPVWIEYFSRADKPNQQTVINLAHGGARTGYDNAFDTPPVVEFPGMLDQVTAYVAQLEGESADPDALYILWAGSNDLLTPAAGLTPEAAVVQAVSNLVQAVAVLQQHGARRIVVSSVPNLGITPLGRLTGLGPELTALSEGLNTTLQSTMHQIDDHILYVDIAAFMEDVINNPEEFELTNVTEACLNAPGGFCGDTDAYLFWDELHPTTRGHRILGKIFKRCVRSHHRCFSEKHSDNEVSCLCTVNEDGND